MEQSEEKDKEGKNMGVSSAVSPENGDDPTKVLQQDNIKENHVENTSSNNGNEVLKNDDGSEVDEEEKTDLGNNIEKISKKDNQKKKEKSPVLEKGVKGTETVSKVKEKKKEPNVKQEDKKRLDPKEKQKNKKSAPSKKKTEKTKDFELEKTKKKKKKKETDSDKDTLNSVEEKSPPSKKKEEKEITKKTKKKKANDLIDEPPPKKVKKTKKLETVDKTVDKKKKTLDSQKSEKVPVVTKKTTIKNKTGKLKKINDEKVNTKKEKTSSALSKTKKQNQKKEKEKDEIEKLIENSIKDKGDNGDETEMQGDEVMANVNGVIDDVVANCGMNESDTDHEDEENGTETGKDNDGSVDIDTDDPSASTSDTQVQNSQMASSKGDFVCDKCGKVLTTAKRYENHINRCLVGMDDDGAKPFQCPTCEYKAKHKYLLRKHQKMHGDYVCQYCDFIGSNETEVYDHGREEHAEKAIKRFCDKCEKAIKPSEDYEEHMNDCQGRVPSMCPECNMTFENERGLKTHMKVHQENRKAYPCPHCDFKSHYKANMLKHVEANHNENRIRDVKCLKCDATFYDDKTMKAHLNLTHSTEKPYSCDLCHMRFKTNSDVNAHIESHETELKFKCDVGECTKAFKNKKLMKEHRKSFHKLNSKTFKCPYEGCDYICYKNVALKKHELSHTGERKFHCDWENCGKSFQSSYNLKIHYRQHTDEKPIKCKLCEYACRQQSSLIWHMKKHHPPGGESSSNSDTDVNRKSPKSKSSPIRNKTPPRTPTKAASTPTKNKHFSSNSESLGTPSRGIDEYDFDSQEEAFGSDAPVLDSPFKGNKRKANRKITDQGNDNAVKQKKKKYNKNSNGNKVNNQEPEPERKKRKYTKRKKVNEQEVIKEPEVIEKQPKLDSDTDIDAQETDDPDKESISQLNDFSNNKEPSEENEEDIEPPLANFNVEEEKENGPLSGMPVENDIAASSEGYLSDEIPEPPDGRTHADNIDNIGDEFGGEDEISAADIENAEKELEKYVEGGEKVLDSPVSGDEQEVPSLSLSPRLEEADPSTHENQYNHDLSRQNSQDSVGDSHQSGVGPISGNSMHSPPYNPYSMPYGSNDPTMLNHDGMPKDSAQGITSPPHQQPYSHESVDKNHTGFPNSSDYQTQSHTTAVSLPDSEPVFVTELTNIKDITKDIDNDNATPNMNAPSCSVSQAMPHTPSAAPKDDYQNNTPISESSQPYVGSTDNLPRTTTSSSVASPVNRVGPEWPSWPSDSYNNSTGPSSYMRPPTALPDVPSLHPSTTNIPSSLGSGIPPYMGQYFPPHLPDTNPLSSYPGQSSSSLSSTYPESQTKATDSKAPQPPDPRISSLHLLQRSTSDFFHRTSSSMLGDRNYPNPESYLNPQSQQLTSQPWMGSAEERARQWGQGSLMPPLPTDLNTNSPLLKNPYSTDRESHYGTDPTKRNHSGFTMPPRDPLSNHMNHFDPMSNPYLSSHFNPGPSGAPGYSQSMPGASNPAKHYNDPYRHTTAPHMSNYRTLSQLPTTPDMFGSMGALSNPAMGLEKYYYPGNHMYRSAGAAASTFMGQTSVAQTPTTYTDRDYSHAAMYSQPGAYGLMDKQYLGSSAKLGHGVPSLRDQPMHPLSNTRDYFSAAQAPAADPHMQDPYRRSMMYNMSRYFE